MTPTNNGPSNSKTRTQTLIASICICFLMICLIITIIVLSLIVSSSRTTAKTTVVPTVKPVSNSPGQDQFNTNTNIVPKLTEINRVKLSAVQKQLQQRSLTWQVNYDTQNYQNEENEVQEMYQHPDVVAAFDRESEYRQADTDNAKELHEASQNRIQNLLSQLRKTKIPTDFDARERWPECPQIRRVYDQAGCGSCWAFASTSMMTDRMCIATEFKFQEYFSVNQLVFCCPQCGQCAGGYIGEALKYYAEEGLVTEQCMPYSFARTCGSPCKGSTYVDSTLKVEQFAKQTDNNQRCPQTCTGGDMVNTRNRGAQFYTLKTTDATSNDEQHLNNATKTTVRNAIHSMRNVLKGLTLNYAKPGESRSNLKSSAGLNENSLDIQNNVLKLELMERGPVASCFYAYEDFLYYKSGIYSYTTGALIYGHCVKVIGWGQDNQTKQNYWTISNSWGKDWGENGFGKIAMIEWSNKRTVSRIGDIMMDVMGGVP